MASAAESLGCFGKLAVVAFFASGHPLVAIVLLAASMLIKPLSRLGTKPPSVEPLLTLPLPAAAFGCDIEVRRNGTVIGVDRGVVTFIEGWLQYEGFRTAFSLSRSDVVQRRQNTLNLADGAVSFDPDSRGATPFSSALDRWYRLDPAVRGISVLPPRRVHRSAHARVRLDAIAALLKNLLAVAGMIAVAHLMRGSFWLIVLLASPLELVGCLCAIRKLRQMAQIDRQALESENELA